MRLSSPHHRRHRADAEPHVRPLLLTSALLMILFLLLPKPAIGQFDSASVLGVVQDPSGAAIPGATVELRSVARGVVTTQQAGNSGQYEFLNVLPGDYVITVIEQGFVASKTDPFTVTVGARQRVDLSLKLGEANEVVTVSGAAAMLQTETSDRGETIQGREAVALPLNGRSYGDLATLVPGVRKSLLENNAFPPRDASYDVNGLASVYNNFQLDGIDNNAYQEANQGYSSEAMVPSPDAIQEFNVQTDNYSAEYGRAGGAIINATTKSGTNAFHGGAYDYLRNTVLNAYGPFIGLGVKPTLVQNQFGGTFGGRIIKNRIFFFVDYEGLRADSKSLTQAELPTAAERAGTFTVDGTSNNTGSNVIPVKNPFTGVVYTNGQVPLTDPNIDPLSTLILKELPLPNIPGAALTANNYQYMGPNTTNDNKGDGRLDFFLSPKQTGFARYSQRAVTYFTAPPIPGPAGGNSNGYLSAHTRQIALGYNYSPTATSILEVRFGYTSTQASKQAVDFGQANVLAGLGFPNVPNNPEYTSGINSQTVTGFSAFGGQATSPQFQSPTQINPQVNYSFVRGHHSLKVGYEYGYLIQDVDDFNPVFGSDTYGGKFSAATSATTQQAANLTDFLFGARNSYSLNNIAEIHLERFWHMGYIQDDWKPIPHLTVNAGLRYEFVSPNFERDNHMLNYDPVNNRILHAGNGTDVTSSAYNMHYTGDGSLAARGLVTPDYHDFGPRLGFSYEVRPGTVIRAGFGISYAYLFRFGDEGMIAYNGPDIVDATISQTPSQGLCTSLTQDPSTCFRRTQDGYQTGFATAQNFASTKAETRYQPANFKTPYVEAWHLSVQQQLPFKTTLEVSYVGDHGVDIPTLYDLNEANLCTQAQVTANNCPSLLSRRPIQGFTDILTESNAGFLSYNALQTKLEHRFADGLTLTNSFTWERALSNSAADGEATNSTGDSAVVNYHNILGDRGPSTYNQPLNDTLSFIADLPYGRGRLFGKHANAFEQAALGGWQLTGINVVTSGLPINLTYIPATNVEVSTTSVLYSLRPNLVSTNKAVYGHQFIKSNTNVSGYLNASALSVPAGYQLFGNASRNSLRGPAFGQLDLAVHKNFDLGSEARTLQFRLEAFNVLNATNFAQPDTTLTDGANFGTFSSSLTSLFPSRQVQVALRLSF